MTGTIYQCSHTITPPQPHGACSRVPSQTIAYHRTVPSHHRTIPSHHRTVPSHHRTVPSHHRTVPSHHRTVPSHRTIAPLHRTIAPSHQASYVPDLFRFFQNAVTPILNLDKTKPHYLDLPAFSPAPCRDPPRSPKSGGQCAPCVQSSPKGCLYDMETGL